MSAIFTTFLDSLTIFSQPMLFVYMILGMYFGMYAGAMPGISTTMAITLMVSVTYNVDTYPALAALMGCYVAGVYGGSRSAVLLNIPGTPASVATAFDGYPLAKQGKAAKALGVTAIQSVIGGIIGAVALFLAAPIITKFALLFAARDYFLLALMGILLLATLSGGSMAKCAFGGFLGLLIGCIGMDGSTAVHRFTFGNIRLMSGISTVAVMLGMFGISEVLMQTRDMSKVEVIKQDVSRIIPTFKDAFGYMKVTLESSAIGTIVGALPGTGGAIAALIAYDRAKKSVKNPEVPFGEGAIEGLCASESANNAAVGGALIPMLTLGIPGDQVTALLLASLTMHGVVTGPTLMTNGSGLFGVIVGLCLIANIFLLPISLTGIKSFAKIVEVPKEILLPIIIVLSVVGSYSATRNLFDVYFMIGCGLLGYFMKLHGFSTGTVALGIILSSLIELNFRKAWVISKGNIADFFQQIFTHPLSLVLFLLVILMVVRPGKIINKMKQKKHNQV